MLFTYTFCMDFQLWLPEKTLTCDSNNTPKTHHCCIFIDYNGRYIFQTGYQGCSKQDFLKTVHSQRCEQIKFKGNYFSCTFVALKRCVLAWQKHTSVNRALATKSWLLFDKVGRFILPPCRMQNITFTLVSESVHICIFFSVFLKSNF